MAYWMNTKTWAIVKQIDKPTSEKGEWVEIKESLYNEIFTKEYDEALERGY